MAVGIPLKPLAKWLEKFSENETEIGRVGEKFLTCITLSFMNICFWLFLTQSYFLSMNILSYLLRKKC
jgi:hypothetical protein